MTHPIVEAVAARLSGARRIDRDDKEAFQRALAARPNLPRPARPGGPLVSAIAVILAAIAMVLAGEWLLRRIIRRKRS